MAPFVGFVLVTHTHPEQIAFLCRKLSSMFDDPPIAIHHDFGKCDLDVATLPSNVMVVQNWISTAWGAMSLVEAYLLALRLLHEKAAPEWTINLSAADYPVRSAEYILNALRTTSADAFFDYREIRKNGVEPADARSPANTFKQPAYMSLAHKRYLQFSVVHYHLRKLIGRGDRSFYVSADWMTWLLTPFSRRFRVYGGDWWHMLNRRAAAVLLRDDRRTRRMRRFYRDRLVPDESFCHTLVINEPTLKVENNNHRYTSWLPSTPHPKTITIEDIPDLQASDAWFARKFPFDPALYAAVDAAVQSAAAAGEAAVPVRL